MPSLSSKYQVIYADPPWPPPGGFAPNASYASHYHYPCMKVKDICSIPVKSVIADNAAIFLWSTYRDLPSAINEVLPAWGFSYKTVAFQWLKLTSKGNPVKVMGYYFFNSTEICLFGVRGKLSGIHAGLSTKVDSLIMEERIRHSQKPKEAAARIERLFPKARKLEMFARSPRPGWDVWGNEVECSSKTRILNSGAKP